MIRLRERGRETYRHEDDEGRHHRDPGEEKAVQVTGQVFDVKIHRLVEPAEEVALCRTESQIAESEKEQMPPQHDVVFLLNPQLDEFMAEASKHGRYPPPFL